MSWSEPLAVHDGEWDGLLDLPGLSDDTWEIPLGDDDFPEADPLGRALGWALDLLLSRQMVWPGMRDGLPVAPPRSHLVDHLVREYVEAPEGSSAAKRLLLVPPASTFAVVHRLPNCDLCERSRAARYDSPFREDRRAFMCPVCYRQHSGRPLGRGLGQFLIETFEATSDVLEATNRALEIWGSRESVVINPAFDNLIEAVTTNIRDQNVAFPLSAWPFESPQSRDQLTAKLEQVLKNVRFVDHLPLALPRAAFGSDGLAVLRIAGGAIVTAKRTLLGDGHYSARFYALKVDESCKDLWDDLVRSLSTQGALGSDALELALARAITSVHLGGVRPSKAAGRLVQSCTETHQVWTAPVRGLLWGGVPLEIPSVSVIGSLSEAFLDKRAALCRFLGVEAELDFGTILSWSEDFFGAKEEAAATGEPMLSFLPQEGLDETLVIAIAIPVTPGQTISGKRRVEALLGALLLDFSEADCHEFVGSVFPPPSWFEGYLADENWVQDEPLDFNSTEPQVLTSNRVAGEFGCFVSLLNVMSTTSNAGVESACWHWLAALTAFSPEVAILHSVIALECMTLTSWVERSQSEITGNRSAAIRADVSRYVESEFSDPVLARRVLEIYDLRSEFVHTGHLSANADYIIDSARVAVSTIKRLLKRHLQEITL